MNHRKIVRIRQIGKHNAFLNNCAKSSHSLILKQLIMAHKIIAARNGHTLLKGVNQ